MMPRCSLLCTLVLLLAAADVRSQEALPIAVFVTHLETPLPPPLKPEEHEAAIRQAREEMFAVAAQLRKQHGEKTSNWPPEVWRVFHDAEDLHTLAIARRDYERSQTQLALADSVEDVLRGASGNKGLTMVKSADEASLVVQITGRRYAPAPGPTDNRYFIRFRLRPGARMPGDRFAELTRTHTWNNLWTRLFARPKDANGYVDLEAGHMASYRSASAIVRAIVEGFVRAELDPSRKK
jgi:hypothetical protein